MHRSRRSLHRLLRGEPENPGQNWVEVNTPFLKRHRDLRIGDFMVQPGTIALGLTGIVAAALVVHGFGMKAAGRVPQGAEFEKVRAWDAKHPDKSIGVYSKEDLDAAEQEEGRQPVMARSIIDPITRIEGHLRAEMEVTGRRRHRCVGFRRLLPRHGACRPRSHPEDAAFIVQRICGVCPVSHMHASSIAAEKAYGISIPNNARIIRNLIEGSQFLHSHILWFYNLAGLDYVNPLNALSADPVAAYDLATELGTPCRGFRRLEESCMKLRRKTASFPSSAATGSTRASTISPPKRTSS